MATEYVPFVSIGVIPAEFAESMYVTPPVFELPKESFAFIPSEEVVFIEFTSGAGLGANNLRTSLILSTAVPVGVDDVNEVNRPSA